ncbi:MAG: tetratricopeptide repeat protein [Hyphomicrobiales bacterium]|nr:tetratricopeptide repeat protein [Hyphomicrobiales bacterium]
MLKQRLRESKAPAAFPADLEWDFAQGGAYHRAGKHTEAKALYEKVLKRAPKHFDALHMLGLLALEDGDLEAGVRLIERSIRLFSALPSAHFNLGNAFVRMSRFEDALAPFERALALAPDYVAAHMSRANALLELKRFDDAIAGYDAAIALQPTLMAAVWNRGQARLVTGQFREGWCDYEARKRVDTRVGDRTFRQPVWLGAEDLAGKTILVHAEQGLGDTLQFCRYIPLLREKGARVLFAPQKPLRTLMRAVAPGGLADAGDPALEFDRHCPLMSLPLAFKADLSTIPAAIPYLAADPSKVDAWSRRLGGEGCRIGISWQGSKLGAEMGKTLRLSQFAALAKLPGVRLISLQKNAGAEQALALPRGMRVETLGEDFDEGPDAFMDTAAVMKNLDLVISVDTSIAHLAGALGVPTWVALKYLPDWRWLLDRADSPWYPSMRLFRQPSFGDWASVFADIEAALIQRLQAASGARL